MLPPTWLAAADVAVVALLLWFLIHGVRRTRARLALIGLAILGAVFLVAQNLRLQLTAWLLQGFFAVLVVVLVVIFQEDLRRLFEQIALVGMGRSRPPVAPGAVDTLVRTIAHLARSRTGALIAIPGREPLERHTEGGVDLDAKLSEALLLSLFDPNSPGHDGAVVIEGDRVKRFAVHLPLSAQRVGGTRHAAALGLAERADALCVAVSEERGTISCARDGRLWISAGTEELSAELRAALNAWREPRASGAARGWWEAAAALVLASALWLLHVPGAGPIELRRQASVTVVDVPAELEVEAIDPPSVEVTLYGQRRELHLLDDGALRVLLDGSGLRPGRRRLELSRGAVEAPGGFQVRGLEPAQVQLTVRAAGGPTL